MDGGVEGDSVLALKVWIMIYVEGSMGSIGRLIIFSMLGRSEDSRNFYLCCLYL